MSRKTGKSSKKTVTFEEPEKKRAKAEAQIKNKAELKELLASKTNGLELCPNGHVFVDGEVPRKSVKLFGGTSAKNTTEDPLADASGSDDDPAEVEMQPVHEEQPVNEAQQTTADDADDSEQGSDATGQSDDDDSYDDPHEEEDEQDSVEFPMPLKNENKEQELQEARASEEVLQHRAKPSRQFLMTMITEQRDTIQKLKAKLKAQQQENTNLTNLTVRLSEENVALKDAKQIPRAKFTTVAGINVTVQDLEKMSRQASTTSMFVGLLVVKLVGVDRLLTMSVTGKPCQRFRNSRNADGTPTHPAQQKLDPQIFEFICDKVAERAAISHGAANVVLVRAESKEAKIRAAIATKIANLKKPKRSKADQVGAKLENGYEPEKDGDDPTPN